MSLRVWLPLNKDLRNQGLSNVTVTNNGATFSDGCANFNGDSTNRYYMLFNDANFMNNYINHHSFSIGGWIKTTTTRNAWGIGNSIISLTYGVRLGVGPVTLFSLYNSSRTISCSANMATNDDNWHHVMGTYDISDNKLRIYVDGVLKNTVNYTSGETYASSWNNGEYIGYDPNDGSKDFCYYQGSLYDIRIYDHALSKKEVAELAHGCVLHYTFDNAYAENIIDGYNLTARGLTVNVSSYTNPEPNALTVVTGNYIGSYTYSTFRINMPLERLENYKQYYLSFKYRITSGSGDIRFDNDWALDWNDTPFISRERKDLGNGVYYVKLKCPIVTYDSTYHFFDVFMTAPNTTIEFFDIQLDKIVNLLENPVNLASSEKYFASNTSSWGAHQITKTDVELNFEDQAPLKKGTKIDVVYNTSAGSGGGVSVRMCTFKTEIRQNKTYTCSLFIKGSDNLIYTSANFLYVVERQGSTSIAERGIYVSSKKIDMGNGWYRIYNTFTITNANTDRIDIYFFSYPYKNVTYWIACPQLEEGSTLHDYITDENPLNTTNVIKDYSLVQGHGSDWTVVANETLNGHPIYKNKVTSPGISNNAGFRLLNSSEFNNVNLANCNRVTISFWTRLITAYGKNFVGYVNVTKSDNTTAQYNWSYSGGYGGSDWSNNNATSKWRKIYGTASIPTGCKSINYFYVYCDYATGGECDYSQIQLETYVYNSERAIGIYTLPGSSKTQIEAPDNSGFNNTGQLLGDLVFDENSGRNTYCAHFNTDPSKSNYLYSRYTPDLNNKSLSFGGWFKFNQSEITNWYNTVWVNEINNRPTGNLIGNHAYAGLGLIWATEINSAGNFNRLLIFPAIRSETIGSKTGSNWVATYGTWNHLFVVYDVIARTVKMYLNGTLYTTISNIAEASDLPSRRMIINYPWVYGGNACECFLPFSVSDVRIYSKALSDTDVKNLYQDAVMIDNHQNGLCYEVNEQNKAITNILSVENEGINTKTFQGALTRYQQTNCQCTITDEGYRIYRPANTPSSSQNQWGGFLLQNINNRMNLQKGHTYLIAFDIKGQTSNVLNSDLYWSHNCGWQSSGTGLVPEPSNVKINNPIVANFNSPDWKVFTYQFTINDDIWKVCQKTYSSFVAGETYVSYRDFKIGFGYTDTGTLGTDLYIKNLRLYDITNLPHTDFTKAGIIDSYDVSELNGDVQLFSNGTTKLNQIYEI